MDKERFLKSGLLEQYVLGLTGPEETAAVERYMQAFPDIRAKADQLKKEVDEYALQSIPKFSSAVVRTKAQTPVRAASWFTWTSAALLAVCAFFALGWYRAEGKIQAGEEALAGCRSEHDLCMQTSQMLAFLEHSDTRPVYLNGTPLLPQAKALIYWNHTSKSAYLNPIRLPQAPSGHQYQVWAEVAGVMISMGLAQPNSLHLQALEYIPQAQSLNITLEPEGGSKQPTVSSLCLKGDFIAAN